jgi:hypothetical protein
MLAKLGKRGYIDPGTTGVIIGGAIWPFIVAVLAAVGGFLVKVFWNPIKGFFSRWRK